MVETYKKINFIPTWCVDFIHKCAIHAHADRVIFSPTVLC